MFIEHLGDVFFTLATIPHVAPPNGFFFDEVLHACAERSFLGRDPNFVSHIEEVSRVCERTSQTRLRGSSSSTRKLVHSYRQCSVKKTLFRLAYPARSLRLCSWYCRRSLRARTSLLVESKVIASSSLDLFFKNSALDCFGSPF